MQPPVLEGYGKWYHKIINIGFFALPLIAIGLIFVFIIYVIISLGLNPVVEV